jgi:hypothetical protein
MTGEGLNFTVDFGKTQNLLLYIIFEISRAIWLFISG